MRTWKPLMVVALAGAVFTSALPSADAQHAMPPAMPGGPSAHMLAETCAAAFEKNIATGRGFGMAFAADRHGYPGPLHVLELATRLGLTPDQQTKVRALQDAMFAESRPKGAALLAAERKLGDMFASAKADEAGVRAAVHEVERLRADLRALHLTMHLKTREVLSPEQRRLYQAERWGTTAR